MSDPEGRDSDPPVGCGIFNWCRGEEHEQGWRFECINCGRIDNQRSVRNQNQVGREISCVTACGFFVRFTDGFAIPGADASSANEALWRGFVTAPAGLERGDGLNNVAPTPIVRKVKFF